MAWYQGHGDISLKVMLNVDGYQDTPLPALHYAASQPEVWCYYLGKLLLPLSLCTEPAVELRTSVLSWQPMLALGSAAAIFASAVMWRRKSGSAASSWFLYSALWFLLTLLPSSSIFVLPDLAAEHRCYLPSIGFFAAVAWAWAALSERWPRMGNAALGLVALAFSILTFQRLPVWSDPILFWTDVTEKAPKSHRAWSNLGTYLAMKGDAKNGIVMLHKALEIEPRHGNSAMNLSKLLLNENRPKEALAACHRHIEAHPLASQSVAVMTRVGQCYTMLERHGEALALLTQLLKWAPNDPEIHAALAVSYSHQRQLPNALHHAKRVNALHPADAKWQQIVVQLEKALASQDSAAN
jgi:tetratricopeptide (TPR) repeat protein